MPRWVGQCLIKFCVRLAVAMKDIHWVDGPSNSTQDSMTDSLLAALMRVKTTVSCASSLMMTWGFFQDLETFGGLIFWGLLAQLLCLIPIHDCQLPEHVSECKPDQSNWFAPLILLTLWWLPRFSLLSPVSAVASCCVFFLFFWRQESLCSSSTDDKPKQYIKQNKKNNQKLNKHMKNEKQENTHRQTKKENTIKRTYMKKWNKNRLMSDPD